MTLRAAIFLLPLLACVPAESPSPALQARTREVMRTHCGACHIPTSSAHLDRALAIFDLDRARWSDTLSDAQLAKTAGMLAERRTLSGPELAEFFPDGRKPVLPDDAEVATLRRFVAEELSRRGRTGR